MEVPFGPFPPSCDPASFSFKIVSALGIAFFPSFILQLCLLSGTAPRGRYWTE